MSWAPVARRLAPAAGPFGCGHPRQPSFLSGSGRRRFAHRAGQARLPLVAARAKDGGGASPGGTQQRRPPPPFPTVAACPEPTCACVPMPEMPPDLPIDRTSPLNGLISSYQEQVLVCTGKDDWPSRIEDDNSGDNLAADLKELFGRGGVYSDPYHHVSVLNSSFPSSVPRTRAELQTSSVYLLPSFRYVPFLPRVSFDSVEALAKGYLLPQKLHPAHDGLLSPIHRDRLTRQPAYRRLLYGVRDTIDADALVLVCGHGGRDARCGTLGPVLRGAFETALERAGVAVLRGAVAIPEEEEQAAAAAEERQRLLEDAPLPEEKAPPPPPPSSTPLSTSPGGPATARVGLISHIGGHKFAGNVIVYLNPALRAADGLNPHPLAGYGVWYGRVEPQHVEGLVRETILRGNVVVDHFRGAINRNRDIIRL